MQFHRAGEEQHYPFRSRRICSENGKWCFNTREGTPAGPYQDPDEARQALAVFLARAVQSLPIDRRKSVGDIAGVQDGVHHLVEELTGFFRVHDEVSETAALAWANNRIAELRKHWDIQWQQERIDVLNYAMNQETSSAKR